MSDRDDTKIDELPPHETGPVPVTVVEADTRWYGITPRDAVLAIGLAAAGVGIVLLVLGSPLVGALVLVLGVLVLAALAWGSVAAQLSGPAAIGRTAVATRLSAGRRLAELRRDLDRTHAAREDGLRALGEAVYRGDDEATERLRRELAELDRRAGEQREEIERTVIEARERMRTARLDTARTEAVSLEPYPPPDEGDMPQQPQIPEPFPPPDEGDMPEQPRVPETSPEPPEQPPEQGERA